MTDHALHAALARLDSAVDRIERASDRAVVPSSRIADDYAVLEQRHQLLRERVHDAVARLDALLDGGAL